MRISDKLLGAALAAGLWASSVAQAGLGGDAASIETDRAQMRGQVVVSAAAGVTVHELTLPSRTRLREYVSPAGKVFAVTWQGPVVPDLRQMLGSYYATFRTTVDSATRAADHHHLTVEQPALVVHISGQMRLRHGLVYVPALLPQGVSPSDLR